MHMRSCHYVFTHVRNFKSTDLGENIDFGSIKFPYYIGLLFNEKLFLYIMSYTFQKRDGVLYQNRADCLRPGWTALLMAELLKVIGVFLATNYLPVCWN